MGLASAGYVAARPGVALLLFLPFDSLASLYVIAAMLACSRAASFRPTRSSCVSISPRWRRARGSAVLMASLGGMALGGWMSGVVFDLTGSYHAAFINGIGWNLFNVSVLWLLRRRRATPPLLAT